jgi:hypothetical protein
MRLTSTIFSLCRRYSVDADDTDVNFSEAPAGSISSRGWPIHYCTRPITTTRLRHNPWHVLGVRDIGRPASRPSTSAPPAAKRREDEPKRKDVPLTRRSVWNKQSECKRNQSGVLHRRDTCTPLFLVVRQVDEADDSEVSSCRMGNNCDNHTLPERLLKVPSFFAQGSTLVTTR